MFDRSMCIYFIPDMNIYISYVRIYSQTLLVTVLAQVDVWLHHNI